MTELTADCFDLEIHHSGLHGVHVVWNLKRRYERGDHVVVSHISPPGNTFERRITAEPVWRMGEAYCGIGDEGMTLMYRAMILWVSQSGSDEYEYQLTV